MDDHSHRFLRSCGALILGVFSALPLLAGTIPTNELQMPQGNTAGTTNGDYVTATTASGGLGTSYHYWIEVPPGLGHLVVEVFDADVGRGGNADEAGTRDRARNTNYNTTATYTLLRPDGSTAATLNCSATTCTDNAWNSVLNSTTAQNTAAGHWELRVTMGAGDDINAIGVRANDGTSGSGGTELNVYVDSIFSIGVHPPTTGTNTHSYTLYPYFTSGCSASENDFDYDSDSGTVGSISLTSRGGGFTQNIASASLSANNSWTRNTFSGWTSDQLSSAYGIWTMAASINSYNNGQQNGNYADIYLGSFQTGANPPTANPPASSFRVYMPNDAGSAPSKPYLDQVLTYGGCGASNDGPNPPVNGQTSCYTITVRMVNPSAQSITFSATHLVTVNVPGGRVVYAGNTQVSQGTFSAPAVGGSGNITWNPGTVTAGSTEILSYQVKVTPNAAGQRNAVTATPASGNGTRAQYVDETGNTTQTRALFTFGPLCELATTVSTITEAVVSDVHAWRGEQGGVRVEWKTAAETGTAGFYLQRWDKAAKRWVRVNSDLLAAVAASQGAVQGGTYRFLDEDASPMEAQVYRLEEVEAGGRHRTFGPYAVAVDWRRPEERGARGVRAEGDGPERAATVAAGRGARKAAASVAAVAAGPSGAHLTIRETGLYHLSSGEIAAWLGMQQHDVESLLSKGKFELSRGGQPVAWQPDMPDPQKKKAVGLFFYGEALNGVYSSGSVYHLRRGNGLLMQAQAAPAAADAAGGTFTAGQHAEQDAFPATVLNLDPESDYWFWEFLQAGDPTYGQHTFATDAPGLAAGPASLTVHLQGATDSSVAGEHHVLVSLNGTPLGDTAWQGIAAQSASFDVPAGVLLASGNQVTLTAEIGNGAPYSIVYVDSFDLSYRRTLSAAGDALAFTADAAQDLAVTGFSNPAVRLLDVGDPLNPRWLNAASQADPAAPGTWRLGFVPRAGAHYLAAAPAAWKTPAAVRAWSEPSLLSAGNRADYLVLAPTALLGAAQRLAALRQSRGLTVMVASLDQVFDELSAGAPTPHAIHDLLAWAWSQWSLPPRYVVLAGAGSLDYRNLLGYGDSLVPPLLVQSPGGLFPSDNGLADANGDGFPEMAVGRIPVLTAAGLDAYTAKLAAAETGGTPDWAHNAIFLSDSDDGDTNFADASDQVAGQIGPDYVPQSIALRVTPLTAARDLLFGGLGQGTAFVNYMGHGGLDRLSAGGLLTSTDVAGLANLDRLPVVTAMTCTISRFTVPGAPSLGEVLVTTGTGGASAVWGPSGLANNTDSLLLAESFYHTATDPSDLPLGDRILHAYAGLRQLGGDGSLLHIYNLLGDPALRLWHGPAKAPTGSPGQE